MKISLGRIAEVTVARISQLAGDVERAFLMVPENVRRTYNVSLNFSAPATVPGFTSQATTVKGVELGDTVVVAASIAPPAGFLAPVAHVSAADTVTVRWLQVTGAAADPDGAGATYTLDIFRH